MLLPLTAKIQKSLEKEDSVWPKRFLLPILCVSAIFLYLPKQSRPMSQVPRDFKNILVASERERSGETPYVATDQPYTVYKYSPGALATFLLLPRDRLIAWLLFKALCIAGWIAAISMGLTLRSWKHVLLLLAGILMSWDGIVETLSIGQFDFIALVGAVLAAVLLERHIVLSGLILGVLPWFKLPWAMLCVPFLMASFRLGRLSPKKYIAGYILSALALGFVVPLLVFGPEKALHLTQEWFNILRSQEGEVFTNNANQSIWSTCNRWFSNASIVGPMVACILFGAFAFVVYRIFRNELTVKPMTMDKLVWVTPWLILTQLLNPLGWSWGGGLYLIGAPFVIESFWKTHSRTVIIFSLVLGFFLYLGWYPSLNQSVMPLSHFFGSRSFVAFDSLYLYVRVSPQHFGTFTIYWLLVLNLCAPGMQPVKPRKRK